MKEIPKIYEAGKYEDKTYELWEKSGFFNPDNLKLRKDAKSYTIVLPPPNITDKLHLGHSSMLAVEDLLIRFHRMKGFRTLWIPGTDHAAIATQNVVEKKLLKKGKTRQQLGKEKFLEEVWKFLNETQATIQHQMRKMGASMDWSREAFTLDEPRKKAVRKMFVDMYDEGLIYRGYRIVNWCPRCHSTLADDEIEYKEQTAKLYTFRYDKNFPFSIATTRPETKLGDTAVAVNPKDKRYKKYIGKTLEADFCGVKLNLKIIGDPQVEMDFGTGALGVTPAHSMLDWQMAQKFKLEVKKVIDEDGKIVEGLGNFSKHTAQDAREMIVKCLKKNDLLEKEEEISNNLSVCYRCGTPIEPLPSKQWFVAVDKKIKRLGGKSLKERALEVSRNKKIKFIPERFTKRYTDWMTNLHDWCISRQIWFGHDIPVWYKENPKDKNNPMIFVGENPPKDKSSACAKALAGKWTQDPDTLDTWFSSGMWTFSTLGWPDFTKASSGKPGKIIKTGDLAKYHPTQVLETGYDILTLWVSRMIIMTLFALGEVPFENVYLHGLVLDKSGKKMSKSKGNGIDPIGMIDKFGTDAVRLSLLVGATPGNDIRMSEEKIASFRNFVTKLWNIYRYSSQSNDKFKLVEKANTGDMKSVSDRWIISRLNNLITEVTKDVENYKFSLAGEKLEKFTWNELADWYVEIDKIEKNHKILGYVLDKVLKLWHPFMPFVTEKIFDDLQKNKKLLMIEKWPEADKKLIDKKAEKEFGELQEIISKIRNIRSSYHIDPARIIKASSKKVGNKEIIEKLARVKIIEGRGKGLRISGKADRLILDITTLIDIDKEKKRLRDDISNLDRLFLKTETLLRNKNFVKSAPKDVVGQNKSRIKEYKDKIQLQRDLLKSLEKL